ncbi:unnamed protein product [Parnassius mnemosyne]|uniref:Uncharacterized protein n=1 Tax=Parnassius mnemosyne TaxID=213953 RepID=A0AAV1L5T2_9NEOP
MLLSYEVVTTFGVSALLSFTVFTTLLLVLAAKSGLLRAGKSHDKSALTKHNVSTKLLPPQTMPAPSAPEPTPPSTRHLLEPREE